MQIYQHIRQKLLRHKDSIVSPELKEEWCSNGFVVLRDVYSSVQCDKYNAQLKRIRDHGDTGKDSYGHSNRIALAYINDNQLLELAKSERITSFLRWAFADEPVVFSSLDFERGTQQQAHVDAIFFYPQPINTMAGVWVALEDIHPDAGPLFYIRGSHLWPLADNKSIKDSFPESADLINYAKSTACSSEERSKIVSRLGVQWTETLLAQEKRCCSVREPVPILAGDVVIWASLTAHGGMPVIDPSRSRKSVVFHFIGRSTKIYTFEQFMLNATDELRSLKPIDIHFDKYLDLYYKSAPQYVTYDSNMTPTARDKMENLPNL